MAISDTQKVDYLFKKLGYGLTKTATPDVKGPENEDIPSPLLLRADKVLNKSADIPGTPPVANTSIITVYLGDAGAVETTEDTSSPPNRTWETNLTDWIPPEFGSQYIVKVYSDSASASNPVTTGTSLPPNGSGNDDEWFFDYQSGVLHFIGTNLPATISGGEVPYIVGYRYTGDFGVGGDTGDVEFANNTITTTGTNQPLIIDPNGTGGIILQADTNITGDLTLDDNIIELANQNAGDVTDIGFVGKYNDGSTKYAGLVRDATDGVFKFVEGLTTAPGTTITVPATPATIEAVIDGGTY